MRPEAFFSCARRRMDFFMPASNGLLHADADGLLGPRQNFAAKVRQLSAGFGSMACFAAKVRQLTFRPWAYSLFQDKSPPARLPALGRWLALRQKSAMIAPACGFITCFKTKVRPDVRSRRPAEGLFSFLHYYFASLRHSVLRRAPVPACPCMSLRERSDTHSLGDPGLPCHPWRGIAPFSCRPRLQARRRPTDARGPAPAVARIRRWRPFGGAGVSYQAFHDILRP